MYDFNGGYQRAVAFKKLTIRAVAFCRILNMGVGPWQKAI